MSRIKLSKPLKYQDKEFAELDLNLDALTGADMVRVETELTGQGKVVMMSEYSKLYLSRLAARAAKLPAEALDTLPAPDFARVTTAVQNFLLQPGSSDEFDEPREEPISTERPPEYSEE